MAIHAVPRKNTYMGNICAFCKYFEADPQLKHHSIGFVAYDDKVKGRCLAIGVSGKTSFGSACSRFELSYEAEKYAK